MKYKNLFFTAGILVVIGFVVYKIYDYYKILDFTNGDQMPELVYPDTSGNPIALSSLRGQIVLVQFWAGWCGPCRIENPHLVEVYNEFHSASFKKAKGFEIYSISLDYNRKFWIRAIKQDQLQWPYHVSTLKGWDSEAALKFGVRSIPASILIDGEGMIIGTNLSPSQVESILRKRIEG